MVLHRKVKTNLKNQIKIKEGSRGFQKIAGKLSILKFVCLDEEKKLPCNRRQEAYLHSKKTKFSFKEEKGIYNYAKTKRRLL